MRIVARRELVIFACLTALAWPALAQIGRLQTFEKGDLSIRTKTGTHKFRIEIARRPDQFTQGLMFRRHLAADAGMLFLYARATRATMWMKNTYIPLDMIFIDRKGKIAGFRERTIPQSLAVISSEKPVSAVLEVNAGTVARLKISIGDQVLHPAFGGAE